MATEFTLTRSFTFEAAHFIPGLPDGHPCGRVHGHSYRVEIGVRGPMSATLPWVRDFAEIKQAWWEINARIDHRTLNDIPGLEGGTAEVLAAWIAQTLREPFGSAPLSGLAFVVVHETDTSSVRVDL